MIDAKNFKVTDKLKDGKEVTFRAIRPDDKKRIVEAFNSLEADSIYTRFFSFKRELTDEDLKTATEVDFEKTVALVVTIPAGEGEETIIGAGRYVLYNPPNEQRSAEIAFTIEEDYHGKGIASRILKYLIAIGREKGVLQFEAEVLRENKAMLAVLARCGLPLDQSYEDGAYHATLLLTPDAPATTSPATPR
jgi:RimJ/RimL family protein N-acetyltransferase